MRHILATITNSPYLFGGVSTWLEQITLALPQHNWRVTTVTHALDEQHLADWTNKHPNILLEPIFGRYARLNEIRSSLEKYLDAARPDIVIINGSYWMMPTIQQFKQRGKNIRVIGICHADEDGYYNPITFYRDCFDAIIGVSHTCTDTLLARGCAPERTHFLPYGVLGAAEYPKRQPDELLRLVYVGRLVQAQKRILDFIPLVRALNERQVNYRLDFYGSGLEEATLRAQIQTLDRENRVSFHGWIPASQVPQRVWAHADILVLVSEYEGLSLSMLEAMGHGIVPVISRVKSGTSQVIREGETGFSFPIGDLDACAAHIASFDQDRAQLATMSRNAWLLTHDTYSIQQHVSKLAKLFEQTTQNPPQLVPAPYMGVTSNPFAKLVPGQAIVYARRIFKRGNPLNEGYTTFP